MRWSKEKYDDYMRKNFPDRIADSVADVEPVAGDGNGVVIILPIKLPTWNKLLSMNRWERMEIRRLIHYAIYLAANKKDFNLFNMHKYKNLLK